tara:strand:- start:1321 stop:2655 length:1335 start_codon:yes stop_codon:yes gene_type:complete
MKINLISILEAGAKRLKMNNKLLLVAILVFLLPLVFVLVTQSFFDTAQDNIRTSNERRLATVHDVLAQLLKQGTPLEQVSAMSHSLVAVNPDLQVVRVLTLSGTSSRVQAAADNSLIGEEQKIPLLISQVGFTQQNNFFRTEFVADKQRIWQAATEVQTPAETYYIFTEQNFSQLDRVMIQRQMESYTGLTVVFLFLIALAYWLNKQVDWSKKFEETKQQLNQRDMFSNMITHEFRAPLTAIKGYAGFLTESENVNGEDKRFAINIKQSAERLVLLVNDFLEVARLQSGQMTITKQRFKLDALCAEVVNTLTQDASNKGLKLSYISNNSLSISSDKQRLTQVLTNIVSNAIKYTNSGSVTIEAMEKRGRIHIYVKDTGTGISAEDQRKLFLPFTRVGNVDDTDTIGSGLGMWITKHLVALLKGTIGVESIEGVGTHVVLSFKAD